MFRLIALVSTMLLSPAASAFSAFDECGALEIALKEQQFSLELDTPYAEISKSHGLRVTFGDDVEEFEYPYISFVHPDFLTIPMIKKLMNCNMKSLIFQSGQSMALISAK